MNRTVFLAVAAAVTALLTSALARADDFVTVRGAYYREASTRVIQPTVALERDSDAGVDVMAHYLVDTITSASVAAGTATDSIFTETRNEVGLAIRKRMGGGEMTASYKYSAESDYWSHAFGLSESARFWGDTARVGYALGYSADTLSSRFRTPACATAPSISCSLHESFVGLSYTQILTPKLLAQLSLEGAYLTGFQGNLYRAVPNFGYERVPDTRLRTAVALRVAYYLEPLGVALRLHYRYYVDASPGASGIPDPWRLRSHMLELRVYRPLTRTLEVRLTYRQYLQTDNKYLQTSGAQFWCDTTASTSCYPPTAAYYSTDPKLGPMTTEYPEIQLVWQAEALAGLPVLGWLAAGTFEISYGRYIQSTSFGDAHVLQSGYTLPY